MGGGQPVSAHGVPAEPRDRARGPADLPLAPRPVRPGVGRNPGSVRGGRAAVRDAHPGWGRLRRGGAGRGANGPVAPPPRAGARGPAPARPGQGHARPAWRRGRAAGDPAGRGALRGPVPGCRVGTGAQHPDRDGERLAVAGPGRATPRPVPRPGPGGRGLRRSPAPIRAGPLARGRPRAGPAEGVVPGRGGGARCRERRARAPHGDRRRPARRGRRSAVRGRHRPLLPRRRSHAGLRGQGPGAAGPARLERGGGDPAEPGRWPLSRRAERGTERVAPADRSPGPRPASGRGAPVRARGRWQRRVAAPPGASSTSW